MQQSSTPRSQKSRQRTQTAISLMCKFFVFFRENEKILDNEIKDVKENFVNSFSEKEKDSLQHYYKKFEKGLLEP